MVEINFLHDRPPFTLPKMSIDFFDENGGLSKSDIDTSGYSLVRTVQTEVVMDIDSAKNY